MATQSMGREHHKCPEIDRHIVRTADDLVAEAEGNAQLTWNVPQGPRVTDV